MHSKDVRDSTLNNFLHQAVTYNYNHRTFFFDTPLPITMKCIKLFVLLLLD